MPAHTATAKSILVVEDDQAIAESLKELLELEGYRVKWAANGRKALDLLRKATSYPNLIVLDLMMPQMDGYQFRAEQEMDPKLSLIPVVLMTADGHIEAKTYKIGAKAYLNKPLDIDQVLAAVRNNCS